MNFIRKTIQLSLHLLLLIIPSIIFSEVKPFLTTFNNTTSIPVGVVQTFTDKSIAINFVIAGGSFQVANFPGKILVSVLLSSKFKDSKGNAYGDGVMKFAVPTTDMNYNIALKEVSAHTVPAVGNIPAFEMPASQAIICTLAA